MQLRALAQLRRQAAQTVFSDDQRFQRRHAADFGRDIRDTIGVQQKALELAKSAHSTLQMRNSVVRQGQFFDQGASSRDGVEQRRGHVVVDHAENSDAANRVQRNHKAAREHGCYLIVVQTSFFQKCEKGYVIRHLRRKNVSSFMPLSLFRVEYVTCRRRLSWRRSDTRRGGRAGT